jgi:vacuolar-type H+-ATPase subunit H
MKILPGFVICGISLFVSPFATAACDYPSKVDIPSGMTATKEDMLQGQRDVKAYVAAMEEYLECIVTDEKIARSEMDDIESEAEQQREDMLNKKYNAAVDDMETIAATFNTEVQAYRSREE